MVDRLGKSFGDGKTATLVGFGVYMDMSVKRIVVCFLLTALSLWATAQSPNLDSLKKAIGKKANDTSKVDALLSLSKAYFNVSWPDATAYSNEALALSKTLKYGPGTALAYKNLGVINYYNGKPAQAVTDWDSSLAAYTRVGDKQGEANILGNLGGVFALSNETKALEYYLRALNIAEEIKDSFRLATLLINIGALYDKKEATLDKASSSYRRAMSVAQQNNYDEALGMATSNLGNLYLNKKQLDSALYYFKIGEKNLQGKANLCVALKNIGEVYYEQKNYSEALKYAKQAYDEASRSNNIIYMSHALITISDVYSATGKSSEALNALQQCEKLAVELSADNTLLNVYSRLAQLYEKTGDFNNAYTYAIKLSDITKKIYDSKTDDELAKLQFDFDLQQKENEIELLSTAKELQDVQLKRQRLAKNASFIGLGLVMIIIVILYRDYRQKNALNKQLNLQKEEIESLLLNVLPSEVAQELRKNGVYNSRYYDSASVMFTDFQNFTKLTEHMTPEEIIEELNASFSGFDRIMEKYGLEKIKTIGDSYMCAGGIPTPHPEHHLNIIRAAVDIREFITQRNQKRIDEGLEPWEIRIGIHVGPLVAGVVGTKKFAYDIWASTVNIASRMESNGQPGEINISADTYDMIKDDYHCTYRGKIYAKNVGEVDMYFLGSPKTAAA